MTRARDLADSADKDISGTLTVDDLTASGDVTIAGDLTVSGTTSGGGSSGTHTGNVVGNVTGNLTGDVTGDVTGNVTGNLTGNVTGDVTGDTTGTHTGAVTGNVTGNLTGDVTGNVTGNVTGDVTGGVTLPANGTVGVNASNALQFTSSSHAVLNLGGSEILRATDGGNLLVGMSTNSITGTGIGLVRDGTSHMYSGGTHTLELGRGGSDGNILEFNRSGTSVGVLVPMQLDF